MPSKTAAQIKGIPKAREARRVKGVQQRCENGMGDIGTVNDMMETNWMNNFLKDKPTVRSYTISLLRNGLLEQSMVHGTQIQKAKTVIWAEVSSHQEVGGASWV